MISRVRPAQLPNSRSGEYVGSKIAKQACSIILLEHPPTVICTLRTLYFPLRSCRCVHFPTPLTYFCICPLGGSDFCSLSTYCRKVEYFSLFGWLLNTVNFLKYAPREDVKVYYKNVCSLSCLIHKREKWDSLLSGRAGICWGLTVESGPWKRQHRFLPPHWMLCHKCGGSTCSQPSAETHWPPNLLCTFLSWQVIYRLWSLWANLRCITKASIQHAWINVLATPQGSAAYCVWCASRRW